MIIPSQRTAVGIRAESSVTFVSHVKRFRMKTITSYLQES